MLTATQRYDLEKEVRSIVSGTFNNAVETESKRVVKRFSPGAKDFDIDYENTPEHKFKSFGHFAQDLIKASVSGGYVSDELRDWQKKTTGYMEESEQAQGGVTVPVGFANAILQTSLEASIVRPRAYYQPMATNRLEIPAMVDSDHSSSLFGGITIYRPGEGGTKIPSSPAFGKIGLTLHKLIGLCYVTDELLEDSASAIEAYLIRAFSQAIAFIEDDDFLNGSGANQSLGALNSANPSLITVNAVAGQGTNTIIAENIIDMWSRLYPAGQANAVWLANPECFPQLAKMSLSVGAGGVPVWLPANQVSGSPYKELMGRELIFTEKCQALGTAGDIALCDFSEYVIGGKSAEGAPQFATSIHIKFDSDQTAFRFVLRVDGQPWWLSALTPKHGTATLSPFVILSGSRT